MKNQKGKYFTVFFNLNLICFNLIKLPLEHSNLIEKRLEF